MNNLITIQDLLIVPFWLLLSYFIATKIKNKHLEEKPYYKYFRIGLFVKIWAGLAFAAIYLFYYGGGDTVYYYWGTQSLVKLGMQHPAEAFKILFGNHSEELFSFFDHTTGYPTYWRDPNSFAVCRFNVPFYIMGLGSYLGNTIVMNLLLYLGIWRFYHMIVSVYPQNSTMLAIAVFFIPSVVFWSSGLLKDGWTLTGILMILTTLHAIFKVRKKQWQNYLLLLFWAYILFEIRPFMLYATLGSGMIWIGFNYVQKIESSFLKTIALPLTAFVLWGLAAALFLQLGTLAGDRYQDLDTMLETAQIIQDDLKKDYYGGNSFDIGSFEPTLAGVIKKAPAAIMAGLFRPYLWEARSPLMLISGIENIVLLLSFLVILFKTRMLGFTRYLIKDPFNLACFILAITMAFSMGLTVSNFGALVRYVIPVKLLFGLVIAITFRRFKSAFEETTYDK